MVDHPCRVGLSRFEWVTNHGILCYFGSIMTHSPAINVTKNNLLILMLAFQFASSALLQWLENRFGALPDGAMMISAVGFLFLLFWWIVLDSNEYGYRRSRGFNIAVILLPIVAIPYYLLRTRAPSQRHLLVIKSFTFCVGLLAASQAGSWLVH